MDELAGRMGNITFVKVNVDDEPNLAQQYRISALPTLKIFCVGHEVGEIVGAPPKTLLEASIQRLLAAHEECHASSSPK